MISAPLTPDTLNTIRRNAGRVAPIRIAQSLGWSLAQLERVARDRQIDLDVAPVPATSAASREPLTAHAAHHPNWKIGGVPRVGRSEQIQTRLFPADARALAVAGSAHGLRPAQALARLVENARARELIEDLVRLPAPMPEGEIQSE